MKQGFTLPFLNKKLDMFAQGRHKFKDNYHDSFSISGGEPTLSPHLFEIIKKINRLFSDKKIICLSNGRRFFYKDYTRGFLQLTTNLELIIPIHGQNARVHEGITRSKGSFNQTIKGLNNVFRFKKKKQIVEIRIVVHGLNYKLLKEITLFIKHTFPTLNRLVFVFFEIEGQSAKNIAKMKLAYSELVPYMDEIFSFIPSFPEVRFYHFPLCTLPVKFYPYIWRTLPSFEVSYSALCKKCILKTSCLGVHKGYLDYFGDLEFKPRAESIKIKKSGVWHHPIESLEAQRQ